MDSDKDSDAQSRAVMTPLSSESASGVDSSGKALVPYDAANVSQTVAETESLAVVPRDPTTPLDLVRAGDVATSPSNGAMSPSASGKEVLRAEFAGEASRQAAAVDVQRARVDVDGRAVNIVVAKAMVAKEREVVEAGVEKVVTDGGEVLERSYVRRYTERTCVIMNAVFISAEKEPAPEELKPTKTETCIDCCCQSFTCNWTSMFQLGNRPKDAPPRVKMVDKLIPVLRRARGLGWSWHINLNGLFPLLGDTFREFIVVLELILTLVALTLSVATVSLGNNEVFRIVHLILTIVGSLMAVFDSFVSLRGCLLYKSCRARCSCSSEPAGNASSGGADADKNTDDEAKKNAADKDSKNPDEASSDDTCSCKRCSKASLDVIRFLLTELILYTLLVCDIFDVITGRSFQFNDAVDGLGFALFILSSFLVFFYVYILRAVIIIGAVYRSHKNRQSNIKPENEEDMQTYTEYDPSISASSRYFQGYFIFHVIMQMLAQLLMIVAIAARIRYDNRHFYNDDNDDQSIQVSGALWYMLVAGYVLPLCGFLTFFIVTYYWAQEFPIGVCIDILGVLQKKYDANFVKQESLKEMENKWNTIKEKFKHYADIKEGYNQLHKVHFSDKFAYPFKTPQMVFLCMLYAFLQLMFVISAGVGTGDDGPLGGGGWVIFYLLAMLIGGIANFYVFLVAALWTVIIIMILMAITILLGLVLLVCLVCTCASSQPSQNRRYYQ